MSSSHDEDPKVESNPVITNIDGRFEYEQPRRGDNEVNDSSYLSEVVQMSKERRVRVE